MISTITILLGTSLWKVALLSGIPLVACAFSGLCISIVQATTQIQEQSIVYAVKFFTVSAVLLFGGSWFVTDILQYVSGVLALIQHVNS